MLNRNVDLNNKFANPIINFIDTFRGHVNVIPNGLEPWSFSRTSTITRDNALHLAWATVCGGNITAPPPGCVAVEEFHFLSQSFVGMAVALPREVAAIVPEPVN